MKTLLEQAADIQALWAAITDIAPPPTVTILRWLSFNIYGRVERAVSMLPIRLKRTLAPPTAEQCYMYVTTTISELRKQSMAPRKAKGGL
jgi:hypothetical protein